MWLVTLALACVLGGSTGWLWADRNWWRDDARELHDELLECRDRGQR